MLIVSSKFYLILKTKQKNKSHPMGQESTKTGDTELLFDMPSTPLGEQNSGPQPSRHNGFGMVQAYLLHCC